MIKKIHIENFRHFENVKFCPNEHTSLLCGLNGAGKSTIVEIINRLKSFLVYGAPIDSLFTEKDVPKWIIANLKEHAIRSSELKNKNSEYINVLYKKINGEESNHYINKVWCYFPKVYIKFLDGNTVFEYTIMGGFFLTDDDELSCRVFEALDVNSKAAYRSVAGNIEVLLEKGKTKFLSNSALSGIRLASNQYKVLGNFIAFVKDSLFAFSINPYNIDGHFEKVNSSIEMDGANFPSWFAWNVSKSLSKMALCLAEYKAFIPGFSEMTFDLSRIPVILYVNIILSKEKNYQLPFASLSHGQKILCVLHTAIKIAPHGSSIFIDEFENFLAPTELVPLYSAMQDAYEERSIQFILVSHHQKTLNWFRDCAFVMTFSKGKSSVQIEVFNAEKNGEIYEYLGEQAGE